MDRTPDQQKLVDAINLLAEYAEKNLPDGYTIVLQFCSDECALELVDEFGEVIDYSGEGGAFADACVEAREVESER